MDSQPTDMATFDYSGITQEQAEKAASKITYINLMGPKTKVSPQMLRYSPTTYTPKLDDEDYARGVFPRFFAMKSNDPNAPIVEITMEAFQGPIKNSPFYKGAVVKWKITGTLEDVYSDDGILQERGVINYNKGSISQAYSRYGIKVNIRNPLEFYKVS